jgi:formylmethanofuran dehydrogenase subunit A
VAITRRRILLAVEPRVLEGALAAILERLDLDDVVQLHDDGRAGAYDAAIVTITLPDDIRSDFVITLPDTVGEAALGRVTVDGQSSDVALPTHNEVIDLLDEQLPAQASRGVRLRDLQRET